MSGGQVFYIIDAESLKSGNAVITIKDKSATAGPIGLMGFGLTTFLLNLHNAGVYEMNSMILAMGFCYGGLAQVIAGILEHRRGNLIGSIAFLSYGFFWWSLVFVIVLPKTGYATAPDGISMGCYLFIWGILSLVFMIGTYFKRAPWFLTFVFATVVVLFMLLASAKWQESKSVEKAAGIEGVICGLSAIYMATAEIVNDSAGRTIVPIGERS